MMRDAQTLRRVAYRFLCIVPAIVFPLVSARSLRVPIVYVAGGLVLFSAIVVTTLTLVRPTNTSSDASASLLALGGVLLLTPIALAALLWIGLGTPWDATASENKMRYGVLLAASIGVTGGFVLLRDALRDAGERVHSAVAAAMGTLSGAVYVVWTAFQLGDFALRVSTGNVSAPVASMNNVFDALLFAAGALAYVATAALARSFAAAGWLGQNPARAYIALNVLALVLLLLRGVSFPLPGGPSPWYMRPGFVVGIPAVPWLMPFFLGVLALRRAGDAPSQ
jgi:hypothetical protein